MFLHFELLHLRFEFLHLHVKRTRLCLNMQNIVTSLSFSDEISGHVSLPVVFLLSLSATWTSMNSRSISFLRLLLFSANPSLYCMTDNYSEPFVLEDAGCTKLQSKGAVFLEKRYHRKCFYGERIAVGFKMAE